MLEETEKQPKRKVAVKEFLMANYNEHLSLYVANLIMATYTSGRSQDDIIVTIVQPSIQPGVPPMRRNVKAKEAQISARKQMDKEDSMLKVISKLIEAEDKKETTF